MEHPTPIPEDALRSAMLAAIDPTPLREANRLLDLDDTRWSYEDLQFSESTQRALIRQGYPVIFCARLRARHTRAARRLLASETSTDHSRVIIAAERVLRRAGGAA